MSSDEIIGVWWKIKVGKRLRLSLKSLPEEMFEAVWITMHKLADSKKLKNSGFEIAYCPSDKSKHICKVGDDIILAFRVIDEAQQLEFINMYTHI